MRQWTLEAVSQTDVLICWFLCHRLPETGPGAENRSESGDFGSSPGLLVSLIKSFPLFVPVS